NIEGAQGLLSYLKTKDDLVRRTFAMKLLGYAFGRTILPSDLPLINRMIDAGPDAPLSGLISEVVVSRQFRNHLGKENAPAGQPAKAAPVKMASAALKNSEKAGTR
ncbi:MAG TPA: DUF1585 domain-containing protein, partial [Bryobacteraceae bacterium]|nr:DUF1585 domain-containing protein [Bryobacteraceae bacterium]